MNFIKIFNTSIVLLALILNYYFSFNIIYSFKEFHRLKKNKINDIIRKINEYIILCKKGIIINQISYSDENRKTKISAIILAYNSEKYISSSIRSVQNQKMLDIEILIIDDNSSDNLL